MDSHTYRSQFTTNFAYSQAKNVVTAQNRAKKTVVYIHGLCSHPWGDKPEAVKRICLDAGLDFFRFELAGHGSDIARYAEADFGIWVDQTLEVIDTMVKGDVILVGSSIGGWLSLVAARERPERVVGVIGLAAAPNYQEDLYTFAFTAEHIARIEKGENVEFAAKDFSYVFTKKLIDSCRARPLLNEPLVINCPVHLLHGQQDACVSWHKALQIADKLTSQNVVVKLLKHSNHRLQSPADLDEFAASLHALVKVAD